MFQNLLYSLSGYVLVGSSLVLLRYGAALRRLWREPVLRHPLLIVESDDWGAGPVQAQATALDRLRRLLVKHRDAAGRHPVVTLALILAVPDGGAIRTEAHYVRRPLGDAAFAPVIDAIERGRAAGVFSLQLHGLEHFWPDSLMACNDPGVQAWLREDAPPATERLPSPLQSRWVDAPTLPSRNHPPERVRAAVAEETELFARILGQPAAVVVPPTFVWTREVEHAWARHGVQTVITPGRRYTCRDGAGRPGGAEGAFFNGMSEAGVTYLVRDDYFEPERGHTAEDALRALARKWSQGRPCLLETHRSNFIGDPKVAERSLVEIERLYTEALARYPSLRFASSEELAAALRNKNSAWIEPRWRAQVPAWVSRTRALRRFWRLARLTGLAWAMDAFAWFCRTRAG